MKITEKQIDHAFIGLAVAWLAALVFFGFLYPVLASADTVTSAYPDSLRNGASFAGTDVLAWQGNAFRYRHQGEWGGKGNDASFVVESDITALPGAGPVHGGMWSVLSMTGGTAPGFAMLVSGYRRHAGPMYGLHVETWDFGTQPGLNVGINVEQAQLPAATIAGSTYIGINNQLGPSARGGVGLQIQSVASAVDSNYSAAVRLDAVRADFGIDMAPAINVPVAMRMGPGQRLAFQSGVGNGEHQTWFPGAYHPVIVGAIEFMVDGTKLYFPVSFNHP